MCDTDMLETIVNKLPLTADGVRFIPGRDIVFVVSDKRRVYECTGDWYWYVDEEEWRTRFCDESITASECYSTREAAEASRSNKGA